MIKVQKCIIWTVYCVSMITLKNVIIKKAQGNKFLGLFQDISYTDTYNHIRQPESNNSYTYKSYQNE